MQRKNVLLLSLSLIAIVLVIIFTLFFLSQPKKQSTIANSSSNSSQGSTMVISSSTQSTSNGSSSSSQNSSQSADPNNPNITASGHSITTDDIASVRTELKNAGYPSDTYSDGDIKSIINKASFANQSILEFAQNNIRK